MPVADHPNENLAVSPEPGVPAVGVPIGRRVMVVSDLLLTPEATPSSKTLTVELARALDAWDGPGLLIIAGNLFDLTGTDSPSADAERSMAAHPRLRESFGAFLQEPERRIIRQVGTHEPGYATDPDVAAALTAIGVEQFSEVDLHLHTATEPAPGALRRLQRSSLGGRPLRPGGAHRPGPDARPVEPADVLDAR